MNIQTNKQAAHIVFTICGLIFFCGLLNACAKQKYVAKPLDAHILNTKISLKNPSSPAFNAYLMQQGYTKSDLPLQVWGINEFTYAALYFNPKLDVAKAQLGLANAAIDTANLRPNPTLNGHLARSDRANGDISPWSYGLNVDIPIEATNKRAIRVEEAQYLRDAAELDVAEIAWQLRSQIAQDLAAYHENIALQNQLSRQMKLHASIVEMLEKRLALGLIDRSIVNTAKLHQQSSQILVNALPMQLNEIRAAFAADTGLSLEHIKAMSIKPIDIDLKLAQQSDLFNRDLNGQQAFKTFQQNALLNRLDIRRSLAKYAAAEAKIKLEVAKQTPDISLTPGFLFEFGDSIWSLGFSNLLNLLNKNKTLIAKATHLREIEGAQFEVLQTSIISNVNLAHAQLMTALNNIYQTQSQLEHQAIQQQQLQKQLDAGLIDRLAVTQQSLQYSLAEQQLLMLKFTGLKAMIAIEDWMQRPLDEALLNTGQSIGPNIGLSMKSNLPIEAILNTRAGTKNE